MQSINRNWLVAGAVVVGLGALAIVFRKKVLGTVKMIALLGDVMPSLSLAKRTEYAPLLDAALAEAGITTPKRIAAFLAQLAHESGELRYFAEIWGPTDAQRRYEPPSDLAKKLGNTEPGDGFRYLGRGPIQLTGRANYRAAGKALGVPLEEQPKLAAEPRIGFRVAAWFWSSRGLNELADKGDFREITRRINGGFNGLEHREKFYARALSALAVA